jgi:nitrite reductase/ring-hydroxylating ferredoxin subunit
MWYPIAASHDLPFRHVYQAKLLEREFAVWRADDGYVNIWQNRCLHRGVRLSIGINDGHELKCQYHGWRYATRTAGCTYIPAHPDRAPARTITNRIYPCVERYGLIWSSLEMPAGQPGDGLVLDEHPLVLRGIAVRAPAALVAARLDRTEIAGAVFIQPTDRANSIIRGLISPRPEPIAQMAVLRHYNALLSALRDTVEQAAIS